MKKIFISCVSSEFKSLRNKAAVALNRNYEPIYQEDFNFEPISLKKSLRKKLENCHGIIHIVGEGYGTEFPPNDPECNPDGNISYTQWELRMVEEMNRKSFRKKSIWLIFPEPDCFKDTAPEWLDWPMNEELSDEDRMAIQQRRRELQLSYKQSLLANSNNYGFRNPKNDYEFHQVIDALVKKEKKKQHIFASLITMLFLVSILAGFWGFDVMRKNTYRAGIKTMEDKLAALPERKMFTTPKYFESTKQPLLMSSLMISSLNLIKAVDSKVADQFIIKLDKNINSSPIEFSALDEMQRQISAPDLKSNLLQVIAGFAFLKRDFESAAKYIESKDCSLSENLKNQAKFEIHYNQFVEAGSNDSTDLNKQIKAIQGAISAMEKLDTKAQSYKQYEFDLLDLRYQSLLMLFSSVENISDSALKEIKLKASHLFTAADKLQSGDEVIKSQIQSLYISLGNKILGSATIMRAKQGRDYKEYLEAEKLFNKALKLLQPAERIGWKWKSKSDEKLALDTISNINAEFALLFHNWSGNILDEFKNVNHEFSLKITDAKVSMEDKSKKGWMSDFMVSKGNYEAKCSEIDIDWNRCNNLFKNHVDSYEFLKQRLRKYQDEAVVKIAIDKAGEAENMLSNAQSTFIECGRTKVINLKVAGSIKEQEQKPDTILIRDLTSIEKCLSELDVPNLEGAKRCIEKLDKLAKDAKEEKAIIQNAIELSNLIKKIFTAEANLKATQGGIVTAENDAAIKEDRAKEYLKPNGFGTVRTEMARKNITEAQTLRRNAQEKLDNARDSVTEQLRQVVLSAKIYNDSYQKRSGAVLAGLAYAVMKRTGISYDGEMPLSEEDAAKIKNVGKTVEGVIKGE